MNKKELVDAIGTQTGISRRNLAQWIGTHPSILSRYLAGTRSLPLRAVQQLLFLHQYLADLPPLPTATTTAENKLRWQAHANNCKQKKTTLEAQYTEMLQNWRAANRAIQLLAVLANDTAMLTPKKQRWIEEQRYKPKNNWKKTA